MSVNNFGKTRPIVIFEDDEDAITLPKIGENTYGFPETKSERKTRLGNRLPLGLKFGLRRK